MPIRINPKTSKIELPESTIQGQIIKYLLLNKYMVIRTNSFCGWVSNTSPKGVIGKARYVVSYLIHGIKYKKTNSKSCGKPDLEVMKDGKMFYIETKTEKGRLSDEQKEFKAFAEKHGMTVLVARDLQDLIDYLDNARVQG